MITMWTDVRYVAPVVAALLAGCASPLDQDDTSPRLSPMEALRVQTMDGGGGSDAGGGADSGRETGLVPPAGNCGSTCAATETGYGAAFLNRAENIAAIYADAILGTCPRLADKTDLYQVTCKYWQDLLTQVPGLLEHFRSRTASLNTMYVFALFPAYSMTYQQSGTMETPTVTAAVGSTAQRSYDAFLTPSNVNPQNIRDFNARWLASGNDPNNIVNPQELSSMFAPGSQCASTKTAFGGDPCDTCGRPW